jgi:ABC-type polysaccharide/polyol phosphate export permease
MNNLQHRAHGFTRSLPEFWTHRTADRSWYGELDGSRAGARLPLPNWLYVLRVLTRHEFQARYRAQALGIVWSLLNPLVMMGLMSFIFTRVFKAATPDYPIFFLIGAVVWQWVSSASMAAANAFVGNADLVKRTVFRRELLPISYVLSYSVNFLMESSLLLLFIPFFRSAFHLSPALLLIPVLLVALILLLSGIALAVAALNVIYRDVAYLVQTALMLLYWLTPVIYPLDIVPYPYRTLFQCNPIGAIMNALRGAIMNGAYPSALGWASICIPTAILASLGWAIFRHYERIVLDYV